MKRFSSEKGFYWHTNKNKSKLGFSFGKTFLCDEDCLNLNLSIIKIKYDFLKNLIKFLSTIKCKRDGNITSAKTNKIYIF